MIIRVFYDGGCYFCRRYAELVALRNKVGEVELISLRDGSPEAVAVIEAGHNVNTGFVVVHEGAVYTGAQGFAYLNSIIDPGDLLSALLVRLGGRPGVARVLYPVLVAMRMLLLVLQGRALIDRQNPLGNRRAMTESLGVRAIRLSPVLVGVAAMGFAIAGPSLARQGVSGWHLARLLTVALPAFAAFALLFLRQDLAGRLYAGLRGGGPWVLAGVFLGWLTVVNLGELTIERRVLGFLIALPVLGIALDLFSEQRRKPGVSRIAAAYPLILGLFVLVPGWIFPPFYGGIAGWTVEVDTEAPVKMSGIKLLNDAGLEIWHNPAFLQPHTQLGRFRRAFLRSGAGDNEAYLAFIFANYRRIYPMLETGRLPHQWALGGFAYPTHSLTDSNAHAYVPAFHPDRIVELRHVIESYDWTGTFLNQTVRTTYRPNVID